MKKGYSDSISVIRKCKKRWRICFFVICTRTFFFAFFHWLSFVMLDYEQHNSTIPSPPQQCATWPTGTDN